MLTGKLTENNNFRFSGTNVEQNPIRTIAISRSTTLKENTTSVPRPTIGEFLGVLLILMVMETVMTAPGPTARSHPPVCSPPPTRASLTTSASSLTTTGIPGAI